MKKAAAIVTDRGGRTCHAAIVARELGVPAVVGAGERHGAAARPAPLVTVSLRRRRDRPRLRGQLPFEVDARRPTATADGRGPPIMVNLGNPDLAFRPRCCPTTAWASPAWNSSSASTSASIRWRWCSRTRSTSAADRDAICAARTQHYPTPADFFVEHAVRGRRHDRRGLLSEAGDRAAVRLQDQRICQADRRRRRSSPRKRTRCSGSAAPRAMRIRPMRAGFALECAALRRVREDMGLHESAASWCRSAGGSRRRGGCIAAMAENGLKRGENGLESLCDVRDPQQRHPDRCLRRSCSTASRSAPTI